MSTTLDIDELERAINKLLAHAKEVAGSKVEIEKDYYWEVPSRCLYDLELTPEALGRELTMGSLIDDWQSTQSMLKGDSEPVALLLLKVAPLLCYLAGTVQEGQPPRREKS